MSTISLYNLASCIRSEPKLATKLAKMSQEKFYQAGSTKRPLSGQLTSEMLNYGCGDLDTRMGSSMAMITGSRSAGPGSVYRIPSKGSGPGPPGL